MQQLFSIVGLFCEDVREEKDGKVTLVGILPENLRIQAVPGMMPKLGFYIRVSMHPSHDLTAISFWMKTPDGSINKIGEVEETLIAQAKRDGTNLRSPLVGLIFQGVASPFPISEFGRVEILARFDGNEAVAAFMNLVRLEP